MLGIMLARGGVRMKRIEVLARGALVAVLALIAFVACNGRY
jgi:hypothetical protein